MTDLRLRWMEEEIGSRQELQGCGRVDLGGQYERLSL